MSKLRKERIISYRIPAASSTELEKLSVNPKVVGIRSANQFARKLTLDFLSGRLVYMSAGDRTRDPVISSGN